LDLSSILPAFAVGAVCALLAVRFWPRPTATPLRASLLLAVALVAIASLAFAMAGNDARGPLFTTPEAAGKMCLGLATDLQRTSSRWALASWGLALTATLLSAIGGLVGRGPDGETRWYRVGAGMLLATLGSSLSATAAYSVTRSNAASAAGAAATRALGEPDALERYKLCLEAKSRWLESRADSLDQSPPQTPQKSAVVNQPGQQPTEPAAAPQPHTAPAPPVPSAQPAQPVQPDGSSQPR
jgi:hypothetical protein